MKALSEKGYPLTETATTCAIGLVAGLFGSLMGLGGGVVMIPLMVGIFKIPQNQAHGTSLVALVFTGAAGALAYSAYHQVDATAALVLAMAALWPARYGACCCHRLPEHRLRVVFGVFLAAVALLLILKPYMIPLDIHPTGWLKASALISVGAATGFISGLLGIGGGAVMVTALVFFFGYEQHLAQGSALLAMIPSGMVGAHTHWRLDGVATGLLKGLIPGILFGALAGGALAQSIPESTLRILFSAVLFWIGLRLARSKATPTCTDRVSTTP